MDFGNKYLTYEEYVALGGTMSISPFELLEFNARAEIDLRTQNRLVGASTIPTKVKMCMFNLIETINSYVSESTEQGKGNIVSESIDGYSISYVSPSQIKEIIVSKRAELDDIMMTYLYGVVVNNEAILYDGVK